MVGGGHLLDGGTQGFVTRVLDGTVRFIPFDYSRQLDRWFCSTAGRRDTGWVPITKELALADCGDWPRYRAIGTAANLVNCQGCHGSQVTTRLEPGRGYQTEWTTLRINCESCHGPARRHVETMTAVASGQTVAVADIGLASRATDGVEESLGVCFQCHATRATIRAGHMPGERLSDYSSHLLSLLDGTNYLPDGRIAFFGYQSTHLSSSCYVDGAMTCVGCHEPHGLGYWDINGAPLADVNDDRQCTGCHASKEVDPALREPLATRRRFAAALGILSQSMDGRGDREGAERALRGARLVLPGDAALAFALGTGRGGRGEYGPAIEALEPAWRRPRRCGSPAERAG